MRRRNAADYAGELADLTVAQQQMVEIAKAISVNAKILIMDEPTAALTETEIDSLFQVTRLLKEQGTGIVYISHRLEELALIADRATVMRDGQFIATVDYDAVKISDLIAMMVGRDLGNIYPRRGPLAQRKPVLEVSGLTRNGVLNNIDFTLYQGEILGFAGLMGAGRTELARAIFGADPIDGGTLKLNGKVTVIKDIPDAIKQGISYLTEDRKKEGLALGLSVERNIMLGNYPEYSDRYGNVDSKRCQKTSEEQVKALRIKTPHLEQAALNLSGGNQQKIIIARWVCKDTDILIFDEPTAVLTPQEIDELMDIMRGFKAEGKSILFITHKLNEIMAVSDRCSVLRKGRYIGTVDIKDTTKEELSKMMVGRDVQFAVDKKPCEVGKPILEVENLVVPSKVHKNNAVRGVSFNVRAGEIVCVAGIDGNGQSELIYGITGLEKPTSGTIRLEGRDITNAPIRERSKAGMSHIPEDRHKHGLVLDYTLADNMVLQRYWQPEFQNHGFIKKNAVLQYAERLIKQYDVRSGQGPATIARSMSGGNQQKAIIAREVDKDPQLLVAVQPTRGLDVGAIEYIHKQIVAERDKGRAVLLVSLELDEVMNLSDRILVIYEGEIVGEFDPKKTTVEELGLYMAGAKKQGEAKA